MSMRKILLPSVFLLTWGCLLLRDRQVAAAADPPAPPRTQVTLEGRLIAGLRAVRPDDITYCERVAKAARIGHLPAKLVDKTYFWAIGRGSDYPFPAFARALEIQCQRLGIAWP